MTTTTTTTDDFDREDEGPCQCYECTKETERLCPCGSHRYLKLDAEGHPILTTEHERWCPAHPFPVALVTSEPGAGGQGWDDEVN